MNKLQLQYVKEQQKLNIITLPSIQKRENIDNSIIEELETIYNPNLLGAETEFKSTLADMSLPHDFLDDTRMISIIRTYGAEAILVYTFLHTKMCNEGYRIEWNEMQEDVYSATLFIYKMDITKFKDILNEFIKNKLLFILTDSNGIKWLTSAYQIFMFERVSAKRVRDRIYKRNQTLNAEEKIKIKCTLPAYDNEITESDTTTPFDVYVPLPFDFPSIAESNEPTPPTQEIPNTTFDDDNEYF